MECIVEMESQAEFSQLSTLMDYNLRLKLNYNYSMNQQTQSRFPVWTLGSSGHLLFQQKDEEGNVYHCRLKIIYTCREIVLNIFKLNKEITVIYGISESHPDTIKFSIEDISNYINDFNNPDLQELIKIADFGTTKGIEKSIKDFEEWKKKEWMKTPEYLLKE